MEHVIAFYERLYQKSVVWLGHRTMVLPVLFLALVLAGLLLPLGVALILFLVATPFFIVTLLRNSMADDKLRGEDEDR